MASELKRLQEKIADMRVSSVAWDTDDATMTDKRIVHQVSVNRHIVCNLLV